MQPDKKDALVPTGTVTEDGTFTLKSGKDLEGAAPGTYKVILTQDVMSIKRIPVIEPLTVEITEPSDGGAFKLEVKMKSKKGGKPQEGPGVDTEVTWKKNSPGGI